MTEILDSGDPRDRRGDDRSEVGHPAARATADDWDPTDPDDLDERDDEDDRDLTAGSGRWSAARRSLADPASLAVAAVLAVLTAAATGPSYVFQSYPFNQGVDSLRNAYSGQTATVHPLHDYLLNAAPALALTALAITCAVISLGRAASARHPWAGPLATGALVVAVALAALAGAGAYRASSLDLTVPSASDVATG